MSTTNNRTALDVCMLCAKGGLATERELSEAAAELAQLRASRALLLSHGRDIAAFRAAYDAYDEPTDWNESQRRLATVRATAKARDASALAIAAHALSLASQAVKS
jgi:hypothetical protein